MLHFLTQKVTFGLNRMATTGGILKMTSEAGPRMIPKSKMAATGIRKTAGIAEDGTTKGDGRRETRNRRKRAGGQTIPN